MMSASSRQAKMAALRLENIELRVQRNVMIRVNAELIDALRWIPVTERMPEFGERVRVWDAWTKTEYIACTSVSGKVSGIWLPDNPAVGDLDVTHWKPLDEQPTEGD